MCATFNTIERKALQSCLSWTVILSADNSPTVRYRGHDITFISSIQIVLICSFSALSHQLKSPTTAAPDTGDGAEEMAMKRL